MPRTAIDTNVLVYLWDRDEQISAPARVALERAHARGGLVITGVVYAELLAAPRRDRTFIDRFLADTGIAVEWELEEPIWRLAGESFREYAERRRGQRDPGPRRLLTDFLIGAHASLRASVLLTGDDRLYRTMLPSLAIERM
jgi:predicted nucleic acid-binding protein